MHFFMIAGVLIAAAAAVFVRKRAVYYRRLFSQSHYKEVFDWISQVVNKSEVSRPTREDGTVVLTSAGLVLAMTKHKQDGRWMYHFSVSEARGYTTRAVGERMLFFIISSLNQNKCEADLYFTQTTVGHLALSTEASPLKINDFAAVCAALEKHRARPIPTRVIETAGAPQ